MIPKLEKTTHEERVAIASRISKDVLKKYKNDVLGVYVCGSTSKSLDRPSSDLELIVVVRDSIEIPMKYYLHRGLIIHIQYLKSSYTLDDAEQFTDNWHWWLTSTGTELFFSSGKHGSDGSMRQSPRVTNEILVKRFESRS